MCMPSLRGSRGSLVVERFLHLPSRAFVEDAEHSNASAGDVRNKLVQSSVQNITLSYLDLAIHELVHIHRRPVDVGVLASGVSVAPSSRAHVNDSVSAGWLDDRSLTFAPLALDVHEHEARVHHGAAGAQA